MKKYFIWGECSNRGVQIGPNWDLWLKDSEPKDFYFEGSMRVIPARLMGLSYPDYLRWCKQEFGARLVGKKSLYTGAIFDKPNDEFLNIINERANTIFEKINIKELHY